MLTIFTKARNSEVYETEAKSKHTNCNASDETHKEPEHFEFLIFRYYVDSQSLSMTFRIL
jgi:hypothetical protein